MAAVQQQAAAGSKQEAPEARLSHRMGTLRHMHSSCPGTVLTPPSRLHTSSAGLPLAPARRPLAARPCCAPLPGSPHVPAVHLCCAPLLCTSAVHLCCAPLLCTSAVHLCCAPLPGVSSSRLLLPSRRRRQGDVVIQDKVFSSDLTWLPHGSEMPDETSCRFASSGQSSMFSPAPAPVHKDILLAKLAPGQSIELEAHCTKGIAKDHAKWSPVATAWYQLQPEVVLLEVGTWRAEPPWAQMCSVRPHCAAAEIACMHGVLEAMTLPGPEA
jgi:hypothetical protein